MQPGIGQGSARVKKGEVATLTAAVDVALPYTTYERRDERAIFPVDLQRCIVQADERT